MFFPILWRRPHKAQKKFDFFLGKLPSLGLFFAVGASLIQGYLSVDDPLKACIDNRDTPYRISATLELYIDGLKAEIPARNWHE